MTDKEIRLGFSYVLNRKLRELGITQREFARMSGLSERTISTYIFGGKLPRFEHVLLFADVLDCTPNDLMCYDDHIIRCAKRVESTKKARKW